jgi:hypothetical protein
MLRQGGTKGERLFIPGQGSADPKNYAHLMRAPSFLMIRARKG